MVTLLPSALQLLPELSGSPITNLIPSRIYAKKNADHLTGARGVSRVDGEDEQEHEQDQEQGETPWGAGAVNPVRTRMNVG